MNGQRIGIIGAGSFGTALSKVFIDAGNEVQIWAREADIVDQINQHHHNPAYLPDLELPKELKAVKTLEEVVQSQQLLVLATPSHTLRTMAESIKPMLKGNEVVITVSKGIEQDTFMTMSQVLVEALEGVITSDQIGVLYGPSHAEEVAHQKPTTVVAASYSTRTATYIQNTCMTSMFRIYVNNDVLGVEIGGSVKNIMAIAAGVIDGAGWGDNTKAALITRGLHEIKRMGVQFGAHTDTFSGLTGMGDLIVTCTSEHSRNRRLGLEIGKGKSLDEVVEGMDMVAEGVKTTRAVYYWAKKHGIEMPITTAIYQVLFEGMNPVDALNDLMNRDPKQEGLQDIYS
jgi:glycerol-3-phosphate dehydrogenase (NAD(P)+)